MKIGELAQRANVTTSRIRFYEKHGLVPAAARQNNGYRDYPEEAVNRLKTIVLCKSLGFSLQEIKRFLPDDPEDHMNCNDVTDNLKRKITDVDQHISDLRKLRKKLKATLTRFEESQRRGEKLPISALTS